MDRSSSRPAFAPDQVLEFTRTFDAPRALVWRMWKEPEHMVRWYGPEGFWLTHCEIDFRQGGEWRYCMSRAADHEHWIYGTYLELREPDRLQFTYVNEYDGHQMVVTMDFAEHDGQTVMHFHQAPFASVEERDSHNFGWWSTLGLLADYVVRVQAAGGGVVGRPRIDGVAEDIAAARIRQEEKARADTANNRKAQGATLRRDQAGR